MKNSSPLIKNIARKLLSIGLVLCATLAQADLIVDTKYAGSSKNSDQMSWDERHDQKYAQFKKRWEKNIFKAIADDNDGITFSDTSGITPAGTSGVTLTGSPGSRERGHIVWNGKHYYAWAVNYQSAEQIRSNREEVRLNIDRPALPGGGICAVYVFDQDLNKLASLKIDLPENSHGTWCNGTYGFGSAGKSVDGVLVTLSYYLAGNKPAQRAQDIGKGWRYMTALIRFEEQDGKLVLKQDDSCLGNPNQYDTIGDARKALGKCAWKKP